MLSRKIGLRASAGTMLILSTLFAAASGNFVTYYMDKKKGGTVSGDSVRVETSLTRVYEANVDASVTVTAASGFPTLTAFIRRFDLEIKKPDGNCLDYFNIYDGDSVTATRLNANPMCGSSVSVSRYNSSGRSLTFQFVTDGTAEMTGVEVIVTSAIKGVCTGGSAQFQCNDKLFCISTSLRCDAYKHCVDGSDEVSSLCAAIAAETNSILYGIIIGSIVGGIAFIIAFVFLVYYCVRERKYKKLLAQLRLERLKKNQVGPVVENEYPVTNRYRKREFKAMFRNEDIEKKDWGLYHDPLYDEQHLKRVKDAKAKEEGKKEEKEEEKEEETKEEKEEQTKELKEEQNEGKDEKKGPSAEDNPRVEDQKMIEDKEEEREEGIGQAKELKV